MSKQPLFIGSGVALVTPMLPDGRVHFEQLEKLVDWHIQQNSDALIVCGTTGEASTLSSPEHLEVLRVAINRAAGRIPIIAGTGSNDTAHCVDMCKQAQLLGADGLLLVTPYYNKTSQRGLVAHYTHVAANTDLPLILYNVPSRTGLNIQPETMARLYTDVDTVVGLKQASGDLSATARLAAMCDVPIYSGNDDQIVPILSLGGLGVISVWANVTPRIVHELCAAFFDGRVQESRRLQLDWLDLVNALFSDVNPVPVKAAMQAMGMDVGACRLPLYPMEDTARQALELCLRRHGLLI